MADAFDAVIPALGWIDASRALLQARGGAFDALVGAFPVALLPSRR